MAVLPTIDALGTRWWIEIFSAVSPEQTQVIYNDLRLFLATFEGHYSRFKPDSIITVLNETGQLKNPDQATIKLLKLGQSLYADSSGIFNCLVGEHLTARGYDANYSFKPTNAPVDLPSPLHSLSISHDRITLTDGQLDLGGYAKGYLIDRLSDYLRQLGFDYFLINGGGDMYASSDQGEPVEIYLEHPSESGTYIAKTTLKDQGFAASSTHKRRWKVAEREYSHIVDTTTPVTADAWATTLLISESIRHQIALAKAQVAFARFNTTDSTLEKSPDFD